MKIPNLAGKDFSQNKYKYYDWLRENEPVYKGKFLLFDCYALSRYQDCADMLRDDAISRNRGKATGKGGSKLGFPMPKRIELLANSMITEDNPEHRRLRLLVNKAFTPRSLKTMETQVEALTHELLDDMAAGDDNVVELAEMYSLPIPVRIISLLMGISDDDMPTFRNSLRVLVDGMSGMSILKTMAFDMPKVIDFVRDLVERKKADPGDDILTSLIFAEEQGDKLSEDELIAMIFLLVFAGFETTVHLINNSMVTLFQHPESLARLKNEPALADTMVEEVLRFNGPIHGTKPNFNMAPLEYQGVTIPKGSMIMPMIGAANRDPDIFPDPHTFDIARTPNKHLGFGYGIHMCLGAWLARLEARVAVNSLIARFPNIELAIDPDDLEIQAMPFWHRYNKVPVKLQ